MGVVGHRRDLCGCRKPSAGSALVSRLEHVDDGWKRGEELPNAGDTCVGVVGRRQDLCVCRKPSTGSVLVSRLGRVDNGWRKKGWRLRVWRLQPATFEILILLYRTPKRRHFDVVF